MTCNTPIPTLPSTPTETKASCHPSDGAGGSTSPRNLRLKRLVQTLPSTLRSPSLLRGSSLVHPHQQTPWREKKIGSGCACAGNVPHALARWSPGTKELKASTATRSKNEILFGQGNYMYHHEGCMRPRGKPAPLLICDPHTYSYQNRTGDVEHDTRATAEAARRRHLGRHGPRRTQRRPLNLRSEGISHNRRGHWGRSTADGHRPTEGPCRYAGDR